MSPDDAPSLDRRIERTRAAILEAYRQLFFAHGHAAVDVAQVALTANVGRSTFYKHFRNKEDLLVQSLTPFLARLSRACVSDDEPAELAFVPEHFWENRRHAHVVFSGQSFRLIENALAERIERELAGWLNGRASAMPLALVAAQIAAAQMTLLDRWLRGRGACTPAAMASALHRSSRALVISLVETHGV